MDLREVEDPSGTGRALAALRQSEAFTRALLDASIDGIVAIDVHGRVVEFNAAAERLFGWARAEALGREMAEIIVPPGLRDAHRKGLTRLLATGESRVFERRIEVPAQRRDGSVFDAELSIVRAPELEPPVFVGSVRNITERKRAEAERMALLERDGAILGALSEIVYEWLPLEDTLHWRGDYSRILGYEAGEMGADTASWTSRVHPDDLDAVLAEVDAARRESRRYDLEYRFRHRDGRYVWMHDRGVLFVDERGELVRLIGVFMDVSERRRYERALSESEERFRSLSALSSDWFWETDAEHRFVGSAPPVTEITGYRADHYLGKRRWEVAGLSPVSGDWGEHRALLERRESFRDFELVQARPDGTRYYLQVNGEAVFDAGGAFLGYRGTAKDITARKGAEEALQRLTRMHAALSALNELIPRVREADELLRRACEIVATSGTFLRAEVRIDRAGGAGHVAAGGGSDAPPAHGASRATRTFALRQGADAAGVLVVYGASADAFDGDISALLERMAQNISFGLDYLETELRFRQTFERAGAGIAHVGLDGRFLRVNPSLCHMLGYGAEELVGRAVKDISHPEDRDLADEHAGRVRAGETESANLEKRYLRKDGSVVWVNLIIAVARDTAGRGAYMISFVEDITARKAEERLLRLEHAATRWLAQADSESAAVRGVLEEICRSEGWECGRYFAVDEDAHVLRFREAWGVEAPPVQEYLAMSRAQTYRRGQGLSGWAWENAQPVWVTDVSKDPRSSGSAGVKSGHLRGASMVLPVLADGRALGVMSFARAGPAEPRERMLQALNVIASQLGQFLRRKTGESVLRESEERFRELVALSSDWYWEQDAELKFVRLAGPRAGPVASGGDASAYVGKRRWELDDTVAVSETWEAHRHCLEARRPFRDFVIRRTLADGTTRYLSISGEPMLGPDGGFKGYRGTGTDITERIEAHHALAASEEMMRGIVHASAGPLLLLDAEGKVLLANPAACELLARPAAELQGQPLRLPTPERGAAEVELAQPDGTIQTVEMRVAHAALPGGSGTVVSLHDLTQRKRYERHIEHLANHDGLTGLPNRTLLRDRVQQAIAHARRGGGNVALLFVDLDHFKLVNDSWGHLVGDALLLEVGARIKKTVRDGDTVARLGGDEFVVLLTDLERAGDAALVAHKIAEALREPLPLDGRELIATASIGIGMYPGDGEDLESLLQCADAAMYRAKEAGRNGFEYYSADMGAQARARVDTESGLRVGLEHDEFRLHYQPQVDLRTGRVCGFEALLRWQRSGHGMVSPAAFIPVAEETGLIIPLGEWALREACRTAAAWSAAGLGAMKVSVNLSARQFWRGGVPEVVRAALGESGLPPAQLEVEITESVVARDIKHVILSLEQLRRMGVGVAIDDFGTGYSSLAYLRSLPIQKLKIDKSFIDGILADSAAAALVAEIVRLAHVLSLEVVAEGVESAAQAAFLREAGCETMQGYVFSRPIPADDCAALLRAGRVFAFEN